MCFRTIFFLNLLFFFLLECVASPVFAEKQLDPQATAVSPKESNKKKTRDPTPMKTEYKSVEERRLYEVLKEERNNLEEKRKDLSLQEKELKTLQVEADKKLELLDKKLTELKILQAKIDESLAKKDVKELKKVKDLSLIYAKMAPDRAALAMTNLNAQLAADLLANMKVKSAAKILDRMDKAQASQLSTTFTTIKVE